MNEHFRPGTAIVGFVFIALGILFLLDDQDVIRIRPMLILPILLIGLGLGVLASITESGRHRRLD